LHLAERSGLLPGNTYNIPLTGVLCEGEKVLLEWPRAEYYDQLTALRNRPGNRKWFLDNRPLDPARNREWLAHGMDRPREALVAIIWKDSGRLLGTAGWSDWSVETREAEFGRLILDTKEIHSLKKQMHPPYQGVGLDMGWAMIRFAFERMHLTRLRTATLHDNVLSIKFLKQFGLAETRALVAPRPNGESARMVEMSLTRESWQRMQHT